MKSIIVLLATDLPSGATVHETCPTCEGGSTREKSLAITRNEDNSLVWVCHRATCSERGGTSKGSTNLIKVASQAPKPRAKFDGVTEPLGEKHLERIQELWGISEPPYWYYAPERNRVAMSIRSPKYVHRGWVLRDIWGRSPVKALTYIDEGQEAISWYKHPDPNAPCVVVEDIPSAVRAARYATAVALLGTKMGLSRAQELAEHGAGRLVLALDQDVTSKSFELAKRYALLWDDVTVLPLERDLKDMQEEELCELLLQVGGTIPTTTD